MVNFSLGFLDVFAPVVYTTNLWLMNFLPDLVILALWSSAVSMLSMYLYKKFSPQRDLVNLDQTIKDLQKKLYGLDSLDEQMWPLMQRYLVLAFKRVGIVLVPTIISAIPIIFLFSGLAKSYDSVEIVHFGYAWMRNWLTWLIFYSLVFSLFFKKVWKIH